MLTASLTLNVALIAASTVLYYFACDQKKQIAELHNALNSFGITQEEANA